MPAKSRQTPIDDDVTDWIDQAAWRSRQTESSAISKMNAWCRWLDAAGVATLAAEHKHLVRYLRERERAGIAATTRRDDWKTIRWFYAWAAKPRRSGGGQLIEGDSPMAEVPGPSVSSLPTTRAAKPAELEELGRYFAEQVRRNRGRGDGQYEARARRNLAMFSLMVQSGCRSGEIPWIDLADVVEREDGNWMIQLHPAHTKSERERWLPVMPETVKLLRRYLKVRGEAAGPLFLGRPLGHCRSTDGRLSARAVQEVISRAAAVVGVPVSSHQLRRGFIGAQIRKGLKDAPLSVIVGHADPRMGRRYMADEEAEIALDRFFAVNTPTATSREAQAVVNAYRNPNLRAVR